MLHEASSTETRDMGLLEQIEHDPDVNQATLAGQLGVAVGTVNWHLKRLISKGYVKVKRAERKKLRYIITPEGIAHRARLTVDYIEQSMLLYRNTRRRASELVAEVKLAGYTAVRIDGGADGADEIHAVNGNATYTEIVDICRLTCLEQGVEVTDDPRLPALQVRGWKIGLAMPVEG
jgi:DNA-binding MarR family transcriptional regulator